MTEYGKVNPWIITIAVMFATFMEVLDTTVVNVSLPHIASTMSATTEEATWVLTSYLVANAIILPMTGWLASKFGRKNLLMASTIGFTLASVLCGLAPNLTVARGLPHHPGRHRRRAASRCRRRCCSNPSSPEDRGKRWACGASASWSRRFLGPVVGGWITENWDWRLGVLHQPAGRRDVDLH
jgi:DHA2 family multidrug resistance protein